MGQILDTPKLLKLNETYYSILELIKEENVKIQSGKFVPVSDCDRRFSIVPEDNSYSEENKGYFNFVHDLLEEEFLHTIGEIERDHRDYLVVGLTEKGLTSLLSENGQKAIKNMINSFK
jgi:hypothetical protein